MDRNYYYRILGLRDDASPAQIKAAYEERMAKLNLPDYGDDPEYVQKKKHQATAAYRVLMGSAPAASNSQRKMRFEKFKDMVEDREGRDDFVESEQAEWEDRSKKKRRRQAAAFAPRKSSAIPAGPANPKAAKKTLTIIIAVFAAIIILSSLIGVPQEFITESYYDADGSYYDYDRERAEAMREAFADADVYTWLDTFSQSDYVDKTAADYEEEDIDGRLFDAMMDFTECFDAYVGSGFFEYITGDRDFYWENDDAVCADFLLDWLGLPDLGEVLGSTDMLNGTPILSRTDYFNYLTSYVLQTEMYL